MSAIPPICNFGWKAVDFRLPATDGRTYSFADIRGPKGTVVHLRVQKPTGAQQNLARMGVAQPNAEQIQAALIGGDVEIASGSSRQLAGMIVPRG